MPTSYQRDTLRELREMGFAIDRTRDGKGSHMVVYITSPTGKQGVIAIPKETGNWRNTLNFKSMVRKLL